MLKRTHTFALDLGDSVLIFQTEDSNLHDGASIPYVPDHPELTEAIVLYCRGVHEEEIVQQLRMHAIPKVIP